VVDDEGALKASETDFIDGLVFYLLVILVYVETRLIVDDIVEIDTHTVAELNEVHKLCVCVCELTGLCVGERDFPAHVKVYFVVACHLPENLFEQRIRFVLYGDDFLGTFNC
jgi:hypothetical protein